MIFEGEYLNNYRIRGKEKYEGEYLFEDKWNGKFYDYDGNLAYELNITR